MADTPTLATLVDAYALQRKNRLAAKKELDLMEAHESELKAKLIEAMKAQGATAIGGLVATARFETVQEPTIGDWAKYYEHIRATGEFELLYRRINPKSIKERKDLGIDIPGVEWFPVEKIHLSQV